MTKIKNVTAGERFFYPAAEEGNQGGVIVLAPGQEWEGKVTKAALTSLKRRNKEGGVAEFEIDGSTGGAEVVEEQPEGGGEDQFDGMTDEQLRSFIEERDDRTPAHNASRETLLKKAREE